MHYVYPSRPNAPALSGVSFMLDPGRLVALVSACPTGCTCGYSPHIWLPAHQAVWNLFSAAARTSSGSKHQAAIVFKAQETAVAQAPTECFEARKQDAGSAYPGPVEVLTMHGTRRLGSVVRGRARWWPCWSACTTLPLARRAQAAPHPSLLGVPGGRQSILIAAHHGLAV